jgi:hypothetical protein
VADSTAQTIYIDADPKTVMDVIADIGAAHEAGLGKVRQVAVDRRAVPRLAGEAIGDVAVRHRRIRRAQQLEDGESRRCRAQSLRADERAQLVEILSHGHDARLYATATRRASTCNSVASEICYAGDDVTARAHRDAGAHRAARASF